MVAVRLAASCERGFGGEREGGWDGAAASSVGGLGILGGEELGVIS